jgi:hypothetical protein
MVCACGGRLLAVKVYPGEPEVRRRDRACDACGLHVTTEEIVVASGQARTFPANVRKYRERRGQAA